MAGNRKLGRTTDHRMAMLRAMVTYLLENGSIETTVARAREVRPLAEKMITLGKKNTLASRRQAAALITKKEVVAKPFAMRATLRPTLPYAKIPNFLPFNSMPEVPL